MYVLRRITFDIQPGDFVSIMGPSGAGKSTLLAILGMLDHHWNGEFWFYGQPVHAMDAKARVAAFLESLDMRALDAGGLEMAHALEWAGILLVGVARNGAAFDIALGANVL